MCVQWCNCVTTSQDVGTGAELIRTMLRTHAHSHTLVHLWAAWGLFFISQHPLNSFFQSFLIPCLLLPCTCHLDICIYSSLCLSRPAWGSQADLKLPSSYPYECLCTFSPPFLLHVFVCVCMCIVYVKHLGRLLGHAWINGHESMLFFYEALNNKKAISYDIDNPVGYRRSAPSLWFTDVPAVLQRSLITTFPGSEKRIYRTVFLIRQATAFLRILNDIDLKW